MTIYQSSPQKTLFEATLLQWKLIFYSNGTNGLTRSKLFFILPTSNLIESTGDECEDEYNQ